MANRSVKPRRGRRTAAAASHQDQWFIRTNQRESVSWHNDRTARTGGEAYANYAQVVKTFYDRPGSILKTSRKTPPR